MTKTLNQIIFFFLHQNQNIFFSNIGNQNNFLEKKHTPPPFKLNGRSLTQTNHKLNEIMTLYDLTNVINEPTRMGALLDSVIVSNIDIVVDSEVIGVDRSISDHNATMINIKILYSIKKTYMRKV